MWLDFYFATTNNGLDLQTAARLSASAPSYKFDEGARR
jgi:hypothetical protein